MTQSLLLDQSRSLKRHMFSIYNELIDTVKQKNKWSYSFLFSLHKHLDAFKYKKLAHFIIFNVSADEMNVINHLT